MKIDELKAKVRQCSAENLEKALIFTYKKLPKSKKEEIDEELLGILAGKTAAVRTVRHKTNRVEDFESLQQEIEIFLDDAREGYYFAPNRKIPKAQRSKWRFAVMRYVKTLKTTRPDNPHYEQATDLLIELYKVMCKACTVYLFNTEDAFASIQTGQTEFYTTIAGRVFPSGVAERTKDDIRKMADLAANPGVSRETVEMDQVDVFMHFMDSERTLENAYSVIHELISGKEEELAGIPAHSFDLSDFFLKESIETLDRIALWVSARLGIADTEYPYYFDHSYENDPEISLYCAIEYVFRPDHDRQNIIGIYDYAVKYKKVKPREELQGIYADAKKEEE